MSKTSNRYKRDLLIILFFERIFCARNVTRRYIWVICWEKFDVLRKPVTYSAEIKETFLRCTLYQETSFLRIVLNLYNRFDRIIDAELKKMFIRLISTSCCWFSWSFEQSYLLEWKFSEVHELSCLVRLFVSGQLDRKLLQSLCTHWDNYECVLKFTTNIIIRRTFLITSCSL